MAPTAALAEAIRSVSDPTIVMRRVTEQALNLIPHADGASLEVRQGERKLEYVCAAGTLAPFLGLRLGVDGSLSGLTVLTGALQRCDETRSDPRVDGPACRRTGVRSMLCIPLSGSASSQAIAALKVSSRQPGAFTGDDELILRELAEFLSVVVNAAAELATVTARLLAAHADGASLAGATELDAARFVANVMSPGLVDGLETQLRVRETLDGRRFHTVLQPIVDLDDGGVVLAEALARFSAPPAQPPDVWFAQAHAVGLGVELELAAVDSALALLPELPEQVPMTLNVGPDALGSPELLRRIEALPRGRTVLELTEHLQVLDYATLREPLNRLRRAGALLAIDDTGSGYNSLQHLLRLEPDVIKLDRELVRDVDSDAARQAMIAALVTFADQLGSRLVAEGIETQDEVDMLRKLGVRLGQGFWLQRPAAVEQLRWS